MIIKLISKKNQKILSLEEGKQHLNLLSSSRDSYIDSLLYAVTENIENYLEKDLVDTTYLLSVYDKVEDDIIYFPNAPIYKVKSVKIYLDNIEITEGIEYTSNDEYIKFNSLPLDYDKIVIEYRKGFEDAEDLPADIKHAAKLQLHDFFNYRGTIYVGKSVIQLNKAVERLLQPYKRVSFL